MRLIESLESRFARLVDRSGDCHVWTGKVDKDGYGRIDFGRQKVLKAHRAAWEMEHGPIPEGVSILHTCDNPPCVRLKHLFQGDQGDNVRDCAAKGRTGGAWKGRLGEDHPRAKLTNDQRAAVVVRKLAGERAVALAGEFGIHPTYVAYLVRNHVAGPTSQHCAVAEADLDPGPATAQA